jgi:hypothetical protein
MPSPAQLKQDNKTVVVPQHVAYDKLSAAAAAAASAAAAAAACYAQMWDEACEFEHELDHFRGNLSKFEAATDGKATGLVTVTLVLLISHWVRRGCLLVMKSLAKL